MFFIVLLFYLFIVGVKLYFMTASHLETHCCWFEGLQIDCSIQSSCHRCRPAMRRGGGCGHCPENSSEATSLSGRQCQGPGGLSEGNVSWWRTGLQVKGDPGPALSGPQSQTACSSPWKESEILSGEIPRCSAVDQTKSNLFV